ncbi:MAG: glycosyltransferase [Actinomycetota bacterium]|nr:glycosyltransferase [Actinomycetota bacterium]
MLAAQTTVVALVAGDGAAPLDRVRAANVRVLATDQEGGPAVERATRAFEQARRTSQPYLVHDADPLGWVAEAWARRFDGHGAVGELEVAVTETLARWRAKSLDLPDYYLLVDAEALPVTRRHWYLGVLGSAAPARVVASRPSVPLVDHLAELRSGPWWPDLDRLLTGIDQVVPDQAGRAF